MLNNPVSEKIELITYTPFANSATANLESATKTITATGEASGIANKDYSGTITLSIPANSKLAITRVVSRIAVTIDSMTAGHVYCKVYVDAQDADHLLFSEDWTTIGAKTDAVDTLVGKKEVIFNLLKNGSAHTFYIFFWVDSGNAVISLVQASTGVGSRGAMSECMTINHTGTLNLSAYITKAGGTGTTSQVLKSASGLCTLGSINSSVTPVLLMVNGIIEIYLGISGSTDNAYAYLSYMTISLRSES